MAITRAQQVFIASGVAGERGGGVPTAYGRLRVALTALGAEDSWGDLPPDVSPLAAGLPDPEPPTAFPDPLPDASPDASPDTSPNLPPGTTGDAGIPAVGERREAPDAAARFGILVHAILERRTEACPEALADGDWWRTLGHTDAEMKRASVVAERLLAAPALRRFFDPACYRRAWNEMEIAGESGTVGRIDRLVEDDEAFWVLDYKSSGPETPRLDEYRAQVVAYCRAVAAIMGDKPVRGTLIFADASTLQIEP